MRVPRDRHAAHRAQGRQARVAAHRDEDALHHDGLRRGLEQGDGQRGARDGGLPRRPEAVAAHPILSLLAFLDGRRLPRQPGRGRSQGCALHGAEGRVRVAQVGRSAEVLRGDAPRRCFAPVLRALALLLLAAAPAWGGGDLEIVTTSTDLKALVEVVGRDAVRGVSLAPAVHEPHSVEIRPRQITQLQSAALSVPRALALVPWPASLLDSVAGPRFRPGGSAVLDCSKGISLLQTETARVRDARGVHIHSLGNPHYWLDPENARPITASIRDALVRLAPAQRARFEENRTGFLALLDERLARWSRAMAPFQGTRVVVVHETWPYFARRFGLVIAGAVEPTPGVPPSPAYLADLVKRMRDSGVRLVIGGVESNVAMLNHVAARSGAQAVTLISSVGGDAEARSYFGLFDVNVTRLTRALASR